MERIVITYCPLESNKDDVFDMAKNDKILSQAIKDVGEKKQSEGIEVFEIRGNIIATEKGYYCAFFENDLHHVRT